MKTTGGFRKLGFDMYNSGFGYQQQKSPENYILEGVALELEFRTSDFAFYHTKGVLDATILQVFFDHDNIIDLLTTRDLTENSLIEL